MRRQRQNKYGNEKVTVDGILFDSKGEANRYIELKRLLQAREIKDLELQKAFELAPTVRSNSKTLSKIQYRADFCYFDNKYNRMVVEDFKGKETPEYKIKRQLFIMKYHEQYLFLETGYNNKYNLYDNVKI